MRYLGVFLGVWALSGCSGNDASHLPQNPLMFPVHAASAGVHNAVYNARRSKVSTYVETHHSQLILDLKSSGGPHLSEAYDLAGVPPQTRRATTTQIASDLHLYRTSTEALTVAFMVHGK